MARKQQEHEEKGFEAPGTLVLVLVFLAWFVLAFIVAWSSLGRAWPVH